MRAVCMFAVCITLCPLGRSVQTAFAQSNREELVDSLFRDVLETQLEKQRAAQRIARATTASNPERSAFTRAGSATTTERLGQPTVARHYTAADLRKFQAAIDAYSQQANILAAGLQRQAAANPKVRKLLPESLRVKATADVLNTVARRSVSLSELSDEYYDLDWRWRNLSYGLQDVTGLDRGTQQAIRLLDNYSDQTCDLLGVEPQFDRKGMLEQMIMARAHMQTLIDDMEMDLPTNETTAELLNEGRQLAEHIGREAEFVRTARYDEIVPRYTDFVMKWRQFSTKLFPLENAHIHRRVARVRKCGEEVYRLLWMPPALDRDYIRHISKSYDEQIDGLLADLTVNTLLALPANQRQDVLGTVQRLKEYSTGYVRTVQTRAPVNELQEGVRRISRERDRLLLQLSAAEIAVSDKHRVLVDRYDEELRHMLRVPDSVNRREMLTLASALEGLAYNLRLDVHRYGPYYQTGSFRKRAYETVDSFHQQTQMLNNALSAGSEFADVKSHCDAILGTWETLVKIVAAMPQFGLTESRFERIDQTRREMIPLMAELAAMVTI